MRFLFAILLLLLTSQANAAPFGGTLLLSNSQSVPACTPFTGANGVNFYNGGVGDNHVQGSAVTHNTYTAAISMWVNWAVNSVPTDVLGSSDSDEGVYVRRDGSNNIHAVFYTGPGRTVLFSIDSVGGLASGANQWHNLLISANTNFSAGNKIGQMYYDGVSIGNINDDTGPAAAINWGNGGAGNGFFVPGSGGNHAVALSEVWVDSSAFIDFSSAANQFLFKCIGRPVSLGANGQTPTGSSPDIYLNGNYLTFTVNQGTSGNFVGGGFGLTPIAGP